MCLSSFIACILRGADRAGRTRRGRGAGRRCTTRSRSRRRRRRTEGENGEPSRYRSGASPAGNVPVGQTTGRMMPERRGRVMGRGRGLFALDVGGGAAGAERRRRPRWTRRGGRRELLVAAELPGASRRRSRTRGRRRRALVDGFRRRRSGSCSGAMEYRSVACRTILRAMSRPGSPLGSPPPGDSTPRRRPHRTSASRSKRGPAARNRPLHSDCPRNDDSARSAVRFSIHRRLERIDEDSARRAHGPKRGRSRLPGTDSMQVMGVVRDLVVVPLPAADGRPGDRADGRG